MLPIVPVRRQIGFTGPLMQPMPTVPFTLDLASTLYFHNAGDGLLLGISDPGQSPGFEREFSNEWLAAFDKAAAVIAPSLVGVKLEAGWAGLYENTPDHNALIGGAPTPRNFLYATGFSGHGFLQAPAVGELVTDLFGRAVKPNSDYHAWKSLLKRAGVRETRLHDARHTAATVLLALEVPERTVMGVMLVVDDDGRALPARNRSDPARGCEPSRRAPLVPAGKQLRLKLRLRPQNRRLDCEVRAAVSFAD